MRKITPALMGGWIVFFFVLYLIVFLKIATLPNSYNNLFFGVYSMLIVMYVFSRFALAFLHKRKKFDLAYAPSVTFVVPAKNEEDNIAETIRRFAEVEYPQEKIEVIAINDGSTDGTYEEMRKIKKEIGEKVKINLVDWKDNRGKRHGMAEGIKRAKGEIVIFVDSDSFIEKNSVWHMVKYFSDPEIGAVSGHTDVFNSRKNLLTKMQALRYYVSFKIYKAAESIFGLVTCCPGCYSAYRRTYLLEFTDDFLNQKFLGVPCTYGDDRSLTNQILKKYKAVYSDEAIAYTVVPETIKKYIKQQQRWKKSWIRETILASLFMWKKNPLAAFFFYTYVFLALASPMVFFRAVVWYPFFSGNAPITYFFGLFLMLFLHGLYYRNKVDKKSWIMAVFVFWLNSLLLIWQLPWGAVTIRDSKWGTR